MAPLGCDSPAPQRAVPSSMVAWCSHVATLWVGAAVVGLAECVVGAGLFGVTCAVEDGVTRTTTDVVGTARTDGDGFFAGSEAVCDEGAGGWVVVG